MQLCCSIHAQVSTRTSRGHTHKRSGIAVTKFHLCNSISFVHTTVIFHRLSHSFIAFFITSTFPANQFYCVMGSIITETHILIVIYIKIIVDSCDTNNQHRQSKLYFNSFSIQQTMGSRDTIMASAFNFK